MDFVTDTLENKRRFKALTMIDDCNREALPIEVDFSLPSKRVVGVLNHLVHQRGKPSKIQMDHGPEFITNMTSVWSQMYDVALTNIDPTTHWEGYLALGRLSPVKYAEINSLGARELKTIIL